MRVPAASGWLAAASLAGFTLVALAARSRPRGSDPLPAARAGTPRDLRAVPAPIDNPVLSHPTGRGLPVPWSFLGLLLAAAVLLAVIWLLVLFGPRLPGWRRARRGPRPARPEEPTPDDLARQVSDTLAGTMAQLATGQIRDAVILCWYRLQQTAETAGLRRSPADTSAELAGRLLATLPLSEEPLNRLAALYREARFSSHPIPDSAVAQARADLARLRSELTLAASVRRPDGDHSGDQRGDDQRVTTSAVAMARPPSRLGLRLLVASGLGLAAGLAVLVIGAAADSELSPQLCAGIGVAAAVLVQLVRETAADPHEPPDLAELAEPAGNDFLSRLRQLERRLEAASSDGSKYDRNVRPVLARLASERLRQKYGIHPARQPAQARQVLGEQLWSLTIAPTAQASPAPSYAELTALVARIEAL